MSQQDDVSAQDILAYSNVETKSDDDDNVFSSGGAIMEALEQANPGIKKAALAEAAKTKAAKTPSGSKSAPKSAPKKVVN